MPKRRYIKLYPEITAHPVFKNAAALQVFIYLLTHADWQTGECEVAGRQIARDCGRNSDSSVHIIRILQELETVGSIEIMTRKPLKIRIPNWKKWQAFEQNSRVAQDAGCVAQDAGCVAQDAGCVAQDAGCVAQDAGCVAQDAGCVAQDASNAPLPYKDSARARDIYNTSNIYNKKIEEREEEEKIAHEKNSIEFFANPNPFRTDDSGYPRTPGEIVEEAKRQCLVMTQEQAMAFLDYYRSFGWTVKGSHIPPNGWKYKIRRWLDFDAEKLKFRPALPATNPNNQRAGFRIDGVEPPTEDFQ